LTTQAPYYAVMRIIEAAGLGTIGTDLYGGEWGPSDAQVLCLAGVGVTSELTALFEQPGVQILVRGEKQGAPTGSRDVDVYARAKSISDLLLGQLDNACIDGVNYKGFEETSPPGALGKDQNERFIYSMNFYTYRNR